MWVCNLDPKDIDACVQKATFNFGKDVLLAWATINYFIPVEKHEIDEQLIWGNSRI